MVFHARPLMVVALTSIAMNLTNPVMRPLVSLFLPLGSTPFSDPGLAMPPGPTASTLSRERVVVLARVAARRDGIDAPPGGLLYSPLLNTYGVGYFEPGNDHGAQWNEDARPPQECGAQQQRNDEHVRARERAEWAGRET